MIKNMTKRMRKILFLSCFFLFILIAPSAVLYSQGYRFYFDPPAGGIKITQTGGLFLKAVPRQADIFIEERFKKRTDFFFGSALIENLLPKKYKIEIKKTGYHSWEKILEIKEKQVTEAKNIILVPKDPEFNVLFNGIKKIWISPNQKNIVLMENSSSGREANQDFWSLKLYETEKQIKTHLISETDISGWGANLISLEFDFDGQKVSFSAEVMEEIRYYEIDIGKTPAILSRQESPFVPQKNILDQIKTANDEIYYLDSFGYLYKTDPLFETKEKMNEVPLTVEPEIEYKIKKLNNILFLQKEKTFYKLNADLKSFEIFFEGINDIKISPDSKKLLYFSDYEIWLLFLEDELPAYAAGDKIFLFRLSEKINDCSWLNPNYLVFITGNKIKISETDNRDRVNIGEIKQIKTPWQEKSEGETKIFWIKIEKKLYFFDSSEKILYQSEILPF